MSKFKNIVICCPGDVLISGGVNSLHNLCRTLSLIGYDASMYYLNPKEEIIQSDYYLAYKVKRCTDLADDPETLFVVPETLVPFLLQFHHAGKMIYWLGLLFYFKTPSWSPPFNIKFFRTFIKCKSYFGYSSGAIENMQRKLNEYAKSHLDIWNGEVFHLSNSYFVGDYCREKGAKTWVLHNPIRDEFYTEQVLPLREKLILFGPHTQPAWISRAKRLLPGFQIIKLRKLPSSTVFDLMSKAMVFVEIGIFSGRDRMPREAAMRGCVVLVNNRGTAGNDKDYLLESNYRIDENKVDQILETLSVIVNNYNTHFEKQSSFRNSLISERNNFRINTDNIFSSLLKIRDPNESRKHEQ
ncbi:MAG: hypothetical protein OEZ43_14765 [Gammaproteobacteria bacterium]|nr:hypothetical protein [Gammaproteobacteria bacterium]